MKFVIFFTLIDSSLTNSYTNKQIGFFLQQFKNTILTATKWPNTDFLTCLLQKVISRHFSWSLLFSSPNSRVLWKFCKQISILPFSIHKFKKLQYHSNKRSCYRPSNSSSSKSYWQTFFMKFNFFFTLLENSLKNLNKIQQLALISTQI